MHKTLIITKIYNHQILFLVILIEVPLLFSDLTQVFRVFSQASSSFSWYFWLLLTFLVLSLVFILVFTVPLSSLHPRILRTSVTATVSQYHFLLNVDSFGCMIGIIMLIENLVITNLQFLNPGHYDFVFLETETIISFAAVTTYQQMTL